MSQPGPAGIQRRSVLVVSGGPPVEIRDTDIAGWVVIAADSGLRAVFAAGLVPDVVIGDLDSVEPADLRRAEAAGARIDRHPADKDTTDLELALDAAAALGPRRVRVMAGLDGRADHGLAGALLLAAPRYAAVPVLEAWLGDAEVHVLHGGHAVDLAGVEGALVSLVPVHGPAVGVTTVGLRYPLSGETLPAGTTRGVSNLMARTTATVTLDEGTLLVIRPGVGHR